MNTEAGSQALPAPGSRRIRAGAAAGALAITASVFASVTMLSAPAQAAAGDPFDPATPAVYVATYVGNTTQLHESIVDSTGVATFVAQGDPAPLTYNSIAFQPDDNYIYGVSNGGDIASGTMVRIGQEGTVTAVGSGTGLTDNNTGVIGPDGNFWAMNANASDEISVLDTSTGGLIETVALSEVPVVSDLAETGGYFWGVRNATSTLVRIDLTNGEVTTFDGVLPAGSTAGSVWTFGNGALGIKDNGTGVVYQVAVSDPGSADPVFTLVSETPGPAGGGDGTSIAGLPTDLAMEKTGTSTLPVDGGTVTYTLTVTNNGPGNSSGFSISDEIPAPLTNVVASDPGCTLDGNLVTCVGGVLNMGDSASYTITADVPAGVTEAIENTAVVTGNEEDPNEENDTNTHIVQPGGISVLKSAGTPVDVNENDMVDVGDTIAFTFDVTNTGEVPLTNVVVNDPLAGAVTCEATEVAVGATTSCAADALYVITEEDVAAGSVDNSATATGSTPDGGDITSPPSETSTPIPHVAAITVVKTADAQTITEVGQLVTYSFLVTNEGNVPLSDVSVDEGEFSGAGDLSAVECPETALAAGDEMTCTATYTVVAADLAGAELTNTATSTGVPPSGDPIESDESTVTVTVPPAPVPDSDGELAVTGGDLALPAAGIALMLLLLGGVMLMLRRSRNMESIS